MLSSKSKFGCIIQSWSKLCSVRRLLSNTTFETHFGFESVGEIRKQEKVNEVFANVADKYDLMNDVMSAGTHRLWKDYFMSYIHPTPTTKLLDVAGGTGDIAFRFLQYLANERKLNSKNNNEIGERGHVTVSDINKSMLEVCEKKAQLLGYNEGISYLVANAECLPVEDNSYDLYTIAFGIRNTTHIDKVLSEAYRVLRPGGRFACLEFSRVTNPIFRKVYDEYSFQLIPVMGHVIAGDWKSYQYLVESIRQFPDQDAFLSMIKAAGFKCSSYTNLLGGIAAIHSGFKL